MSTADFPTALDNIAHYNHNFVIKSNSFYDVKWKIEKNKLIKTLDRLDIIDIT
jgi:hypothetical protein